MNMSTLTLGFVLLVLAALLDIRAALPNPGKGTARAARIAGYMAIVVFVLGLVWEDLITLLAGR